MDTHTAPPSAIVVGVDGSPSSDVAVDWAAAEATRRNLPLHVIHAFSFGYPMTKSGFGQSVDHLRQLAHGVRNNAVARARTVNPDLAVTWDEPSSGPAPALVKASETAATVVVGARGLTGAPGLHVGSVSAQLAMHARCPVVVVHDHAGAAIPAPGAPVVVGVDGSTLSANAIAYAYEQARSRGVGLTVVHAWWLKYVEGPAATMENANWQRFAEQEHVLVATSLAGWQDKYPEVLVRSHSVRGLPVEALVRQSENACLVVVGTRGRGGFAGLLLGSVSQGVMQRSRCPVAIVHAARALPHEGDDRQGRSGSAEDLTLVAPVHQP